MKKDRNSFFSQYGVSSYNTTPYAVPNQIPFDPNFDPNMTNMNNNFYPTNNQSDYDLEAKINRLEREIKIIDQRLSKIESELTTNLTNNDYNFANSMYMV